MPCKTTYDYTFTKLKLEYDYEHYGKQHYNDLLLVNHLKIV